MDVRKVQFCQTRKKIEQPDESAKKTIPKKRRGTGQRNQDISEIHNAILNLFEEEVKQIPELQKEAARLKWISENSDDPQEQDLAKSKLTEINNQLEPIESGFREARYIHRTAKLLEEYDRLLEQPTRVNFMGNKIDDQQESKQTIIAEYLNIAKDYVPVNPIEGQRRTTSCKDCKIELQREDDFFFVCPTCGYAMKHFASIASYQENTRINVAQRYVYDKRAHFGDSIKKYQAKQNTTILPKVYQDLWGKCEAHEIPIEKLTKDHLYEFLRLTGHSDHYEDITLIYCEITGRQPPDISHLEQQLFALFDEIEPVYERIKPAGRVNFLNGQYVLFKLLQKLRFPCREEDFYILKTREKMLEHDQIWKLICDSLHWTYRATV
jgi:hypothetical protein